MIPYADLAYFVLVGLLAVPVLIPRLGERIRRPWILIATGIMLVLQYSVGEAGRTRVVVTDLPVVIAWGVYQLALAQVFLRLRLRLTRRVVFYTFLGLSLLPLVAAKVAPLVAPQTLVGFLGISYVTFRALDVIFGVQDRLIQALPVGQYVAYLLFFPTISAGPIDRYRRFEKDWTADASRTRLADVDGAAQHLFRGLLYKFILAALIQRYWLAPAENAHGILGLASYMYAYSFYLFFDFAGYSALAISASYLFGIHSPENFHRPFIARDIRDFWNRWHMSLSFWFRDHVYMRFVLAATKGKWFKGRYTASYLALLLNFVLIGMWHGLQPNYILYGLYHAVLMIGYEWFSRWNKAHKVWGEGRLWHAAAVFVTFNVVCVGFLIFSGHLSLS
ncbi:MAG: D-alanyl-lipoteichoic acid biosynthesis protein DltB [Anaerolineae bacterium]